MSDFLFIQNNIQNNNCYFVHNDIYKNQNLLFIVLKNRVNINYTVV